MRVSRASRSSSPSEAGSAPFFARAFSPKARYMAPLSRYRYPSRCATTRATLLFPDPAGPSMAIVSLRMEPVGRRPGLKTHDVVAAVHVNGFTSDPGAGLGEQKRRRRTYLSGVHVALERRPLGVGLQHVAQVRDAA